MRPGIKAGLQKRPLKSLRTAKCTGQKFLRFTRYKNMAKKVMLFTLQTFSTTGGIQKMTRTLAHSLNIIAKRNDWDFKLWSVYDLRDDLMPEYLPVQNFRGFGAK